MKIKQFISALAIIATAALLLTSAVMFAGNPSFSKVSSVIKTPETGKTDSAKVKGKYKIVMMDNGKKKVKEGTFNDQNLDKELEEMLKDLGISRNKSGSFSFSLDDNDNHGKERNIDLDFNFDFFKDADKILKEWKYAMGKNKIVFMDGDSLWNDSDSEKRAEQFGNRQKKMHERIMEKYLGKQEDMKWKDKIDKMSCEELRETMKKMSEEMSETKKEKNEKVIIKIRTVNIEDADENEKDIAKKNSGTKASRELKAEDLKFYPNPSDGKFNLSFSLAGKGETTVKVLDLNSKEIYSETLKDFSGKYEKQISLPETPKGIYLLQIVQGKKLLVKKIGIQ